MNTNLIGYILIAVAIIVIIIYGYLIFFTDYWMIVLKITAFILITLICIAAGWVGYVFATTPPPRTIEEIEKELEEARKEIGEAGGGL